MQSIKKVLPPTPETCTCSIRSAIHRTQVVTNGNSRKVPRSFSSHNQPHVYSYLTIEGSNCRQATRLQFAPLTPQVLCFWPLLRLDFIRAKTFVDTTIEWQNCRTQTPPPPVIYRCAPLFVDLAQSF